MTVGPILEPLERMQYISPRNTRKWTKHNAAKYNISLQGENNVAVYY